MDYGVRLWVVRQDLEKGVEVLPGKAPVWPVREPLQFGGIYDTVEHRFTESSDTPLEWFCSEAQFPAIVHSPALTSPTSGEPATRILCYGAEGVGKSQVLAMWMYLQILDLAQTHGWSGDVGATAPTHKQLTTVVKALRWFAPIVDSNDRSDARLTAWGSYHAKREEISLHLGITIQGVASKGVGGKTAGSPIQGYNWAICGSDEHHETAEQGRDPDIEARLRAHPTGESKRLCTATAKDTPAWRNFRDGRIATGDWTIHRMPARTNSFVLPDHWDRFERNLSEREKRRRIDALDVGPERATYYNWDRELHIMPVPDIAEEVTSAVLAGYQSYMRPGASFQMLVGHDPGQLKQTSTFLRLFIVHKVPVWFVVGEFVTEQMTTRQHARALKEHLQERWGLQHDRDKLDPDSGLERVLVIRDPHDRGKEGVSSDIDIAFQKEGFDVFSASPVKRQIRIRDRVEMVNRLMMSSRRVTRLYVATRCEWHECPCHLDGTQCAPTTVEGFESLERDIEGKPEQGKKGPEDKTHAPVSVGYALWPFEQEAVTELTQQDALNASKRRRVL